MFTMPTTKEEISAFVSSNSPENSGPRDRDLGEIIVNRSIYYIDWYLDGEIFIRSEEGETLLRL